MMWEDAAGLKRCPGMTKEVLDTFVLVPIEPKTPPKRPAKSKATHEVSHQIS